MNQYSDPLSSLNEIKSMMEKSSRFLSLSGLSGVAEGIIALIGAGWAYKEINDHEIYAGDPLVEHNYFDTTLFYIGVSTLILAVAVGFLFTYLKSKKLQGSLWNHASRRMMINLGVPLAAGGILILKLIDLGYLDIIAPACLLFYGLALVGASKYTLGDIRYLGYLQLALGAINLLFLQFGLVFWALGFGAAHILYGGYMWHKYDRQSA